MAALVSNAGDRASGSPSRRALTSQFDQKEFAVE